VNHSSEETIGHKKEGRKVVEYNEGCTHKNKKRRRRHLRWKIRRGRRRKGMWKTRYKFSLTN
jgi:hypothetical protein